MITQEGAVKPEGFSEAGISTRDIDAWEQLLRRVGGWETVWRGESPSSIKPLWGIDIDCPVLECLMCSPGTSDGYIRLFQFGRGDQELIRGETATWDSGGIFDLDLRVAELYPFVDTLLEQGWRGVSQPVDWPFGPVRVREWLATGPDAVTLALIERLEPPLEQDWNGRQIFGQVFNSSQTVADMERAMKFYATLGFQEVLRHHGPLSGRGGEVLGLSPEQAPRTVVDLAILQPDGAMSGSVELVKVEGLESRDVSNRARPHNLGLNLLRFPVNDLSSFAQRIGRHGLQPVEGRIVSTRLEPFGQTEILALQTPDGAWLEFYQAIPAVA
jgi:catechol 2,3-dioxygenase-like lactoylglutathione lyase family enzyme